jgi:hypothetical protein
MSGSRKLDHDLDLSDVPVEQLEFLPSPNPATPDDLRWAKMAGEARFNGLPDIQRTAERWGATILVITGLLTTLTVVRGASDLAALRDLWPHKILVGSFAGIALLVAIISVILAAMAAQGQPVEIVVSGPRFEEATGKATRTASGRLKWSRYLAVLVVPFYLAALGIMAYAPQATDQPPTVTVIDEVGGTYCGTSAKKQGGNLVIVGEKGVVAKVPLSSVVNLSPAAKCPGKK